MAAPQYDEEPGPEQPFISHLIELRDRLLRMVAAIALVFLVLFPFANDIYTFVAEPIRAALPEGSTMIATQVASPFLTPFKLALVASVFVAMPYLLFQVWGFVAPGLYQHEKRLALPLLASSIVLFYLGMTFAYFVVFPLVFAFFASVTPDGVAQMPDISFYLEFVLKLFFAFGVAFEIPIATILLVASGVTTPEALAVKRPYVIVGVFVAGMLLTPPDVISQTLLALPMWMLYEAGIFFSRFFQRRTTEGTDEDATDAGDYAVGATTGGAGFSRPGEGTGAATGKDPPQGNPAHPGTSAVETPVGRDISGGDPYDPDRFRPMTQEEIEAELDAIDAPEITAASDQQASAIDPSDAKLAKVMELRDQANIAEARKLLYEVLTEGNAEQRRVARNVLEQLDAS